MIELFLVYFCDIFEQVREWIWKVAFGPCAGLKQDIEDSLLLDQVFYSLPCETFRNSGGFGHVNTIWRRDPILLNGSPAFYSDNSNHLHGCLKSLFKHGCHVKIFRKVENVRKEVLTCLIRGKRNGKHFVFLHHQSEDVPGFVNAQSFTQDHSA